MPKSNDLKSRLDELFSSVEPVEATTHVAPIGVEIGGTEKAVRPEMGALAKIIGKQIKGVIAEESLLAFMAVLESSPVGVCLTTVTGRLIQVNDAFASMLGYKQEELSGEDFQSITYPEDYKVSDEALQYMLSGACDNTRIKQRYLHKDNHPVWCELYVTLLRDENSKPLQFFTITQDISEQKQTADMLEKRVRELDCLNDIGHKIDEQPPLPEFLTWVTERIPDAMRFPEDCITAIEYGGQIFGKPEAIELPSKVVGGLRVRGELIGWLHIAYTRPGDFIDAESALIGGIVSRVTGYIESRHQLEELETVNQITSTASSTLDRNEILTDILTYVLKAINFCSGLISMLDPDTQNLYLAVHQNLPEKMVARLLQNGMANTVCEAVFQSGTIYVADLDNLSQEATIWKDLFVTPRSLGFCSYLGIPLESKGKRLGTICAFNSTKANVSPSRINLLQAIGQQLGVVIENALLFQETEGSLAKIQQSQSLLKAIIDATPDWIFTKDLEHRFLVVNKSFANALKHDIDDFSGKNDLEVGFPEEMVMGNPEKGVKGYWWDDQQVMDSGEQVLVENEPNLIDGVPFYFDVYKAPLKGTDGKVWGMLGFARDVTRRKLAEDSLAKRATELATVAQVSSSAATVLDSRELLQSVVNLAKERFNLYHVHIYLINEAGDTLTLAAGAGEIGQMIVAQGWQIQLTQQQSLVARCARQRHGVIVDDVRSDPEYLPNEYLPDTASEMAVPLIVGDELLGVLDVQSDQINYFTEQDLTIQATLAYQVAVALQNAHRYEQAQRALKDREKLLGTMEHEAQQLAIFNEMARDLTSVLDVNIVMQKIYDYASRLMDVSNLFIAMYDRQNDQINFPLAYNDGQPIDLPSQSKGKGLTGYVIDHRQPLLLNEDIQETMQSLGIELQTFGDDLPALSWLGVPLLYGDQVLGMISVQSVTTPGLYTEHERDLLIAIASQAAFSIQNARLFEEAQRRANESRIALAATEILYSGSERVVRASTINDVLSAVVESNELSKFDYGNIMLFDKPWDEIKPKTGVIVGVWEQSGKASVVQIGTSYKLDEIPYTSLIKKDALTFVSDLDTDSRIDGQLHDTLSQLGKSLALFPLVAGDNWIGWLAMLADHPVKLSQDQLRQIASLVVQASTVIQSQRLQQGLQDRLNELTSLQRMMSREAWAAYQAQTATGSRGYLFDRFEIQPMPNDMIPGSGNGRGTSSVSGVAEEQSPITRTLSVRGEPIGVLGIKPDPRQLLSPEDEAFLESIAEQVAQALERARLMEQTQKSAVELQAVADVSTAASTILEPDQLLQSVVDLTKNNFGLYHAHIYLVDDVEKNLVLTIGAGEVGQSMVAEGWSIPIMEEASVVARVARQRKGLIVSDIRREENFLPNPSLPNTLSELAVPMIVGDDLLGVFDVQADRINRFSEEDVRTFTTLASQVAVALQNAKLYAEQTATVERLRELDNMKSAFLANMSHELRTPLNSILGFTQVIAEGLDGPLTDMMFSDLELIEKNGKHLLNLINDVLDMAKIEAGRLTLSMEPINMYELLEDVIMSNSTLARDKNLNIRLEAEPTEDWTIIGDHVRLRQIMINLIGNSIKFTDTGGITLEMEKFSAIDEHDRDKVQVRVIDTGIGIPPNKLEEIFEAFSQVDSTTTRKTGGTGLGLPISRKLVELHGGRLWAMSSGVSGQGSTLYLELPLSQRSSEVIN